MGMPGDLVLREDADGIAVLTLNRPDKLNSLDTELFRLLDRHIATIRDSTVQCVVLKGAGRCFSAGHDLGVLEKGESLEDLAYQGQVVERLSNLPQAVIAAVHSHCYTGALELVLGADIILASADAKFADTHARFSLVPYWGMTQRLPRRVGSAKAREMIFTARTIPAEEAAAIGLVNHVYPDDRFADEVMAFARTITANAPHSIASYKKLMADTDGLPLRYGLAHEVHNNPGFGADMVERVQRFTKKSDKK
jgi:enoyl-CoA hydratase